MVSRQKASAAKCAPWLFHFLFYVCYFPSFHTSLPCSLITPGERSAFALRLRHERNHLGNKMQGKVFLPQIISPIGASSAAHSVGQQSHKGQHAGRRRIFIQKLRAVGLPHPKILVEARDSAHLARPPHESGCPCACLGDLPNRGGVEAVAVSPALISRCPHAPVCPTSVRSCW